MKFKMKSLWCAHQWAILSEKVTQSQAEHIDAIFAQRGNCLMELQQKLKSFCEPRYVKTKDGSLRKARKTETEGEFYYLVDEVYICKADWPRRF